MLAPSPNLSSSAASLTRSVPLPPAAARVDACAVSGEEAPAWLAVAFGVAGTLIAVMSAALWQQGLASPPRVAIASTPLAAPPVPVREERIADPLPKLQDMPVPAPAPIKPAAPPEPAAAPPPTVAIPEPPSPMRKATTECFAPLAIGFERGSARPDPADVKRSLAILHKALSRHGDAMLVIEGHTDASGSEELNVLLSYSRAKAIAELLKHDGIPARRISVRAAGAGEARGDAGAVAGDRKAVLRIAGVDDCDQLTAAKRP
ncbi:hypothetical protein S58_19930 [Bradyrhizobium oligotrophicum S58]|uniref:OmpA-like domain-containing protein n=1 Tax=Bradyrhizobium oligotrophicum S58 TaxID=1245469 RepID=M4ZP44_9BRAD|nr:OmpA family protein [Bradyrhizobium oligotrophicum]BAM88000.1 hypothetical protein S58_19930 [Bradyrhizobium oligotrophicum S58]